MDAFRRKLSRCFSLFCRVFFWFVSFRIRFLQRRTILRREISKLFQNRVYCRYKYLTRPHDKILLKRILLESQSCLAVAKTKLMHSLQKIWKKTEMFNSVPGTSTLTTKESWFQSHPCSSTTKLITLKSTSFI